MRRILVLGAGQSSPYLIRHLLEAQEPLEVTVADRDLQLATARVGGHPRGRAVALDASDEAAALDLIRAAEVVVNLLAPSFQVPVARLCLEAHRSMISASYRAPGLLALDDEARRRGVVLLSELGLDPGLDHLSAARLLDRARAAGARVRRFFSYGAGVLDPTSGDNPLGYAVTWNPRNVVRAGAAGARYLEEGVLRLVPYPELFLRTWPVEVPGEGRFEAYANRDSTSYIGLYGLEEAATVVRATLRRGGFAATWHALARLGLTRDDVEIEALPMMSWRALLETHLAPGGGDVSRRLSMQLGLHPTGAVLDTLRWLGLFDDQPIGALSADAARACTPADALEALLKVRLALPPAGRDLVILHHVVEVDGPDGEGVTLTSTLVERGVPGVTAMAKTVGLPAALAALEILNGTLPATGAPLPLEPALWRHLLPKVEAAGLRFSETGPAALQV